MKTEPPITNRGFTRSEARAVLHLLTDADEALFERLKLRILRRGPSAMADLITALRGGTPPSRLTEIEEEFRLIELEREFGRLGREGHPDLETGMLLLSGYRYAGTSPSGIRRALDRLAARSGEGLPPGDHAVRLAALAGRLFGRGGFTGNRGRYYDPANSYLASVLERRTGIPISLSALLLLICRRLDLPADGVGIPGHFLVRYHDPRRTFWIDPFNAGRRLDRADCRAMLERSDYGYREEFLAPIGSHALLFRMIRNLVGIYAQRGEGDRVRWLLRFGAALAPASAREFEPEGFPPESAP